MEDLLLKDNLVLGISELHLFDGLQQMKYFARVPKSEKKNDSNGHRSLSHYLIDVEHPSRMHDLLLFLLTHEHRRVSA